MKKTQAFTLVELIIVIVILGILAVVAAPRFIDIATDAKINALKNMASQIKTIGRLSQAKARASGIEPTDVNPYSINNNPIQTDFLVDFGFGEAEVHYSSLCPESQAEGGDRLTMLDFLATDISDDLTARTNNQYTWIGYTVPASGTPTDQGCYLFYNSFSQTCEVTVVTTDC